MNQQTINLQEIRENIAKNLRRYRKLCGITSGKEAAKCLNVNFGTYRGWENGKSIPNIATLYNIAKSYRVTINDLCGIDEEQEKIFGVASDSKYGDDIYGDEKITELDSYDKRLVMLARQLSNKDRKKLGEYLLSLLPDNNK